MFFDGVMMAVLLKVIRDVTQIEQINFLLTNRIPRRWATLFMGWFSQIEIPLVRDLTLATWRLFSEEINLQESKKAQFKSLHDCFIRELKEGARPINQDPNIVTSPCDAIVGASGSIEGTTVFQAKGFPYTLMELLGDSSLVEQYQNGTFVTLRLKSTMYHRFHAPCQCDVSEVIYISGDTWNVNPIALKRVERLFCKNERAVINLQLNDAERKIALVPVAAILVASIRLHFLNEVLNLEYKGPNRIACDASFKKGEEMGYFHQGSTFVVFASKGFEFCENVQEGSTIRVGHPLFKKV